MAHNKNTRGNVVDYSLLAGKSRPASVKQNGGQKENAKAASSIDDLSDALVLNSRGNIIDVSVHEGINEVNETIDHVPDVE